MKRKIGAAALLAVLVTAAFTAPAMSQCVAPVLISFGADVYAYEQSPPYDQVNNLSGAGATLTVVGKISCFGPPLDYLNANITAGTNEYTFIWTLTSAGTVGPVPAGSGVKWDTDYTGGTFSIYDDNSPDAPNAASVPLNPPAGSVPGSFVDGAVILSGVFDSFHVQVTRNGTGRYGGSWTAGYRFTGGSLFGSVGGAASNAGNTWCTIGLGTNQCMLPSGYSGTPWSGYSAHASGKFDAPASTSAHLSTWGTIKMLYR
jgi:hypothetical protein